MLTLPFSGLQTGCFVFYSYLGRHGYHLPTKKVTRTPEVMLEKLARETVGHDLAEKIKLQVTF